MEDSYSRAIPIRWPPAFPPKAVVSDATPCTQWKAGQRLSEWVRKRLDLAGRNTQPLVVVADGALDVLDLWRELPQRTILPVRTARNRSLYSLPEEYAGRGRPPSYGEKAPHPADWLHAGLRHWLALWARVRGKEVHMRDQVLGPFVREGLAEGPLFLIVVKGVHRQAGKRKIHYKHRGPSFYLVNAIFKKDARQLPLPTGSMLAWLWQRWEIEVAHREMKSGLGPGEKQCWNRRSAITPVQWSAWVYALFVLAAWRTWGLTGLSNTRTLVVWTQTLVVQHPVASISCSPLGYPSISPPLALLPQRLAEEGTPAGGFIQLHFFFLQKPKRNELRLCSFRFFLHPSPLLKQPRFRRNIYKPCLGQMASSRVTLSK